MEMMYRRCAGLDVHKRFLVAAVRVKDDAGALTQDLQRFSTRSAGLRDLVQWLEAWGVTHVAMESTGVLWKPVYRALEERFTVYVCNARHLKQVPGRKTDVTDSQWIAQLLQCGLLRPSFVPPRALRELRDLTRHRVRIVEELARTKNRIHKVLDEANLQLSSVASDILGVSGRAVLKAVVAGEQDPAALAQATQGRLKASEADLKAALEARISEHHRFQLEMHLMEVRAHEVLLEKLDARIQELIAEGRLDAPDPEDPEDPEGPRVLPFAQAVERVMRLPGVSWTVAVSVLAETGCDMNRFATAHHLAAWAGLCPGQHESAGRSRSGHPRKGNVWVKRALTQAAWAASRTKGTRLQARYRRLAAKRGAKRAVVAVAHTLLRMVYALLRAHGHYVEDGADYYDRLNHHRLTHHYRRRLEQLGYRVILEGPEAA